ncbi:MAG: hypothetical protein AAB731_03260 [Patescibacteria group bacterium]
MRVEGLALRSLSDGGLLDIAEIKRTKMLIFTLPASDVDVNPVRSLLEVCRYLESAIEASENFYDLTQTAPHVPRWRNAKNF